SIIPNSSIFKWLVNSWLIKFFTSVEQPLTILKQFIPTRICYNWDSPFSSQATSDRGGFLGF
ncbi:TPA: hypothetical protein ACQOEM_001133, partial [Streptococcus pyogenes]